MVRRVLGAGLVLLVAATAAYALVGKVREPDRGGYPQRIGFERPSDPLPARPGPLAATVVDNDFGNGRDLGVTPTGRLYELPLGEPALSPSGTVLVTRSWERGSPLEVHDLAAGNSWVVDGLPRRIKVGAGGPAWSPDETRVLLASRPIPSRDGGPAVVDLRSGEVTGLPAGSPAGFVTDTEAVTVAVADGLAATVTDLDSGTSRDLALRPTRPWAGDPDTPPPASVSPDGQRLMLLQRPERGSQVTVRLFSLDDGRELSDRPVRGWDGCAPSWRGDDPVVPVRFEPGGGPSGFAGAQQLTAEGARSLVAVHPRLQSRCLVLSSGALAAGPRWAFFGTSTALVTWYAVPALALALVAVGGALVVVLWVRRRRRAKPA